jgi:hypothetical protein
LYGSFNCLLYDDAKVTPRLIGKAVDAKRFPRQASAQHARSLVQPARH